MTRRIKAITVNIMEKDYSVACPQGEEGTLMEAVEHVDQVMHRIKRAGRTVGMERIAVMAALNMAHELIISKHNSAHRSSDAESDQQPHDQQANALSTTQLQAIAQEEAQIAQQLQALTEQVQAVLNATCERQTPKANMMTNNAKRDQKQESCGKAEVPHQAPADEHQVE